MPDIDIVICELQRISDIWEKNREDMFCPIEYTTVKDALSILKEYKNEHKRSTVIVCPHCGKRVK